MLNHTNFKDKPLRITALLLLIVLLFGTGHVLAQGALTIPSWTVDGGGGSLTGQAAQGTIFTLYGTLSQPDTTVLAGGSFRLYGGFWGTTTTQGPSHQGLYLPSITNSTE